MLFHILAFSLAFTLLAIAILHRRASKYKKSQPQICIMLGSGGHTTQMQLLFRDFYFDRCANIFVLVGLTDTMSQAYFSSFFQERYKQTPNKLPKFSFIRTKRTNEVKQSKITSVLSTLIASAHALIIIIRQLLGVTHFISNGPGISVPYFYILWVLNKVNVTNTKLIFVESWCRVSSLSVTGKLVHPIVHRFIVHWESQKGILKNAEYLGKII